MRNLSFVKRMTALGMALLFLVASNVTRVEAAPANNLTPEQIEAIVLNMYDKFTAFDAQGTEGIGIVKVNENGKIQSARNFFDLAYFQSQLTQ